MSFFNNLSALFGTKQAAPAQDRAAATGAATPAKSARPLPQPTPLRKQPIVAKPAKQQENQTQPSPAAASALANQPAARGRLSLTADEKASVQDALREAQSKAREIIVEAKAEALSIRSEAERKSRELSAQLENQQRSIDSKLDKIDERLNQMAKKEAAIDAEKRDVESLKQKLQKTQDEALKRLEKAAHLTVDEAKDELFSDLEKRLAKDMAQFIRQKEETAKSEADDVVKEILVDAMKHGATDYVSEYTISVVTLPSEESKGKIIGKSGRNIHTFEKVTGVDVDLDVSPTEVRLSCYDPVRREIARIALERLVKDGRIQPSRIEETVEKVRSEIDKIIFEAGKSLCHELNVYNLPADLMKLLGKFKYRFSYGQNMIAHTLEETKIGVKLASELGIDANTVKLGCLLHDIGKVSEEEEGSHIELGVKIAKRFNMPQGVIDCIAQHHEDEPFTGAEQMVVYIADAISGARPGARYENYEEYVKRLTQLEDIAQAYEQVKQAYAIQAGREVRVLLEPERSKDDDVKVLSLKIKDEIQNKVTYPGTVTVTVIRETRGQAVAK